MGRYRKKPVVIDAVKAEDVEGWIRNGDEIEDGWVREAVLDGVIAIVHEELAIQTKEGNWLAARLSDYWIIRGVKGEIYPCEAAIFEATYETEEVVG